MSLLVSRRRALALALPALLLAGPVAAQENTFSPPEVTVDLSVLDNLAPGTGRHPTLHPPRAGAPIAPAPMAAAPPAAATPPKPPAPPKPVAAKTPSPPKPVAAGKPALKPVTMTPPPEPAPTVAAKEELPPPKPAAPAAEVKPETPPPPPPPPSEAAKPAPTPPPTEEAKTPAPEPKMAAATPPPAPPKPPAAVKPATAVPPPTAAPVPTGIVAPLRVAFAAGTADLSDAAKLQLDSVAKSLASDELRRVQLIAYAGGGPEEANQARRLSLSRALNVRAYLIDRGVRNTRMDVRALGNRPDAGEPADRVDVLFVEK